MSFSMVLPDGWDSARFLAFFAASAESRFEGESTLPPQAGNADRYFFNKLTHFVSQKWPQAISETKWILTFKARVRDYTAYSRQQAEDQL